MRRVLLAVAVVAGVIVPPAQPVGAVIPDKLGWWAKYQLPPNDVGASIPPPPVVASDQFAVAGDVTPEGLIIAAIRYVIPEGASARLKLQAGVTQTGETIPFALPPGVFINACITSSGWDGAVHGPWASRPAYDCERLSAGGFVDGTTMTFEFPAAFQESPGVLDFALVPAGTPAPSQAIFTQPDDAALELFDVPPEPTFDLSPPETFFGDVAVDAGAAALALDPGLAIDDQTLPALDQPAGGPPVRRPQVPFRRAAVADPDTTGDRVIALLLLLAFAVGLWWISGRPMRVPRLLGSLGQRE